METIEIYSVLEDILQNEIKIQVAVSMDLALLGGQVLDSLDFMNYITIVEEKFSLTISDEDISTYKLGIIQNMVDYIHERV